MKSQKNRNRTRWDDYRNQPRTWPPVQHEYPLNSWGQGSGPWCYPPPSHILPHHPPPPSRFQHFSEFDQFAAAYQSDRFDRRDSFGSPYWNDYGNNVHQHAYDQIGLNNFQSNELQGNIVQTGKKFCEENQSDPPVKSDPLVCPNVQSSGTETVKNEGTSHSGGKPQKNQTQEKVVNKDVGPKETPNNNKKKVKKVASCVSQSKTCAKGQKQKHHKSILKQQSSGRSGVLQNGTDHSKQLPLLPQNGNGLLGRAPMPYWRGGQNGSSVSGRGAQNGIFHFGRSLAPVGRGGPNWRPPLPFGRGAHNLFSRTARNSTVGAPVYDEDDESNEINHWLCNSKGKESISGKDNDSVNKDPLPGSEEARTNAIKEAADRLKQALKNKTNVNLNNLLSSGEESKSDYQAQSKLKSFPKNLAQLELDASDMRAIGRANTEKTNCQADDDSDDDIIEVQRPPSPVPQVIDLESNKSFQSCSGSSDDNDGDEDVCLGKRLRHLQSVSPARDKDDLLGVKLSNLVLKEHDTPFNTRVQHDQDDVPLSTRLQHDQDDVPLSTRLQYDQDDVPLSTRLQYDQDDVPLSTRLQHVQYLIPDNENHQADGENRKMDPLVAPKPSALEDTEALDIVDCQTGQHIIQSPRTDIEERSSKIINDVSRCKLNQHEESVSQRDDSNKISHDIDSGHNVGRNIEMSTHSQKNGAQSLSKVSPRVVSVGKSPLSEKRLSKNFTLSPAPNLGQRRRSYSPEPPAKPGHFEPQSPLSTFRRMYDSKQRKIISDLKKINQSKLKDLINNPRSGKLDFAMKQLMKEHRSVLSKMSRDVAEKRIPAEYLNPKSTELPPDDSTLLADFAIDWSSLPGELISTLGDLFTDFNSDTPMNICELQCHTSSESCNSPVVSGIELLLPDKRTSLDQEDNEVEGKEDSLAPAMISAKTSNPVKIRVCQFANEKLCSPSENDTTSTLETNLEQSSSYPLPEPVTEEPGLLVQERQPQMDNSNLNMPNEGRTKCSTHDANQTEDMNPMCSTPRSLKDCDRATSESLNTEVDSSINLTESLQSSQLLDNVSVNSNSPNIVNSITKMKRGKQKGKMQRKKLSKLKRVKFVRLEERSWFDESTASKKANSSVKPESKKNSFVNPFSQSHNGTMPPSIKSLQITGTVSSENIVVEDSRGHNDFTNNENQNNLPNDVPSCITDTSNVSAAQNQCVSMLPVLMMTVPANETSSTICNLTVSEMQKRIVEIDRMLQDLVQERCILSQSLKAAERTVQNTSLMHSAPQSLDQDDVALNQGNVIEIAEDSGETSKRKCSFNGDDRNSKRVCHSDSQDLQNIAKSSSNVQGSLNNLEFLETVDHTQSVQEKSKVLPKESKQSPTVTSHAGSKNLAAEIDCFLNHPPYNQDVLNEVKGQIYDIKTCGTSIYAASDNGMVYWIIDDETRYVQGYFGKETKDPVRSIQVNKSCLYAASYSGLLNIYDIPDRIPKCYLHPISKHSCTIANTLMCTVFDWDKLYCGTGNGIVIPFNTKSFLLEERLFEAGHPILSMVTKTDCAKRYLIVAYRRHPTEIRDAESGLLLRSFGGNEWTVYTVICYDNLVYCGANKNKILVYWFKNGEKCTELQAGTGIITMKLFDNYLVCGCHDGKIYIFNLRFHVLVCSLNGPGDVIYSINFNRNKMLCSTRKRSMVCITATHPLEKPLTPEIDQDEVNVVSNHKEHNTYPLEKPLTPEIDQGEVCVVSNHKEHKASEFSKHEEDKVCVIPKDLTLGDQVSQKHIEGNILAIKVKDLDVFAASSNGLVYWFNGLNWRQVPSTFGKIRPSGLSGAVTCLEVARSCLYTGSEDGILSIYSIPYKQGGTEIVEPKFTFNISNGIQCMEACWDFLYIGTRVGSVIPFKLDSREVGEPLSSGDYPILCIKTCKEGPRRVLIVASRQQPIAIRDAKSGLLLRSLEISSSEWTVYSILCHNNLVYCGSNKNKISVFDFQSGETKFELDAGQGITAMKVCNNHLFCGCYDGKIYVFDLETSNRVCSLDGPGQMILALDFLGKQMVCSSKGHPLTLYKYPMRPYFKKYHKLMASKHHPGKQV